MSSHLLSLAFAVLFVLKTNFALDQEEQVDSRELVIVRNFGALSSKTGLPRMGVTVRITTLRRDTFLILSRSPRTLQDSPFHGLHVIFQAKLAPATNLWLLCISQDNPAARHRQTLSYLQDSITALW